MATIKPGVHDLEVYKGGDFEFVFDIEIDGVILPLDGVQVYSQDRCQKSRDAELIVEFEVGLNLETKEITLSLSDEATAGIIFEDGYYDVLLVTADGKKNYYVRGYVEFHSTVSSVPVA